MTLVSPEKILVLGSGNFGTSLAQHLGRKGHRVMLWARSRQTAEAINTNHQNPKYLKGIKLDERIRATQELESQDFSQFSTIILSIPTQFLREVLEKLSHKITPSHLLICAAKGIEVNSLKLPSDIVRDVFGSDVSEKMVSLSGPSFAIEVAQGQPTGVSVASHCAERAKKAQQVFHTPKFRAYTSEDPIGLEVAGALKNIIAIAAGACAGFGFKSNSLATLITRGLAEITRVGVKMGANPLTFKGLGGVGDLFLTCSSSKSRNYSVGFLLAKGKTLENALAELQSVAEGVFTTKAAYQLGKKLDVSTPIIDSVHQVLYGNQSIEKVLHALLMRDSKPEFD